jgi:hypothetical protein
MSSYSANKLFSGISATMFYHIISLHLFFTSVLIPLKLHCCWFSHTNASPLQSSSSFTSFSLILTFVFPFCHSHHCFTTSSVCIHITHCQYFTVNSIALPHLLSLSSSISTNQFAAQLTSPISFIQNLIRTMSISFQPHLTPHTSTSYLILDSYAISYILCNIHTFTLGGTDKYLPPVINAWHPLALANVLCLLHHPVFSRNTPIQHTTSVFWLFIFHLSIGFNFPLFINIVSDSNSKFYTIYPANPFSPAVHNL